MVVIEMILLVGILLSALGMLFCKRMRTVITMYMTFSLLLALLWGLDYGLKLAVTELAMGCGVTSLLFLFALRKLQQKGPKHE